MLLNNQVFKSLKYHYSMYIKNLITSLNNILRRIFICFARQVNIRKEIIHIIMYTII